MVISIASHPWQEKYVAYDEELNEYEEKFCNITVKPWETEKVDEYFKNIVKEFDKPITYLYLVVSRDYYNEIRNNFIFTSKKHGIKHFHIINGLQKAATCALKYLLPNSNSLWLFSAAFHEIICAIWEKSDPYRFKISEVKFKKWTSSELSHVDLQSLKNEMCSASVSPAIVFFKNEAKYPEDIFRNFFNDFSNINFCSFNSLDFFQEIQRQKKSINPYVIEPMLDRSIDIKFGESYIQSLKYDCNLPYQTEYSLKVLQNDMNLKVYESGNLTQTLGLQKHGTILLYLKIDIFGIFTISFKKKGTNWFSFAKSPLQQQNVFKIPSKLTNYDRYLNAVGIDLGTSECCAFVIRNDGPEGVILDPVTNQRNIPSFVAVNETDHPCGQIIVNRMETYPEFSAFDVKRLMGKDFDEIVVDPLWPFNVINYCNQIHLLFGNKTLIKSPVIISTYLLKQIKRNIEEFQGTTLDEAVITIPSSFTEKQKEATRDAANSALWRKVHFLPEPFAALIAYSYENDIPNKINVLLFDCGGGTTDICVAKINDEKIEILNDSGDSLLGGKDFDKLLINYFNSVLKHKYGLNVLETNRKYRLMIKCREIKHTLSVNMVDRLYVDDFKFNEDDDIPIHRTEFENMAVDLILRAKNLIAESIRKVKLNRDDINIVFQVGGGCRMPMIKQMLEEMFPKAQHQCSIHPEELVAKGAALYAYSLKTKKK
uniref:Uncharacterized protein n=1 Tax=Panagrolaimus sp. ES5 TaxID=591445 RepID=A0AC34FII3_9BILA